MGVQCWEAGLLTSVASRSSEDDAIIASRKTRSLGKKGALII